MLTSSIVELEKISPKKAECNITNSDQASSYRWTVSLWNCFGKWVSSSNVLHEAIDEVIVKIQKDNFKNS